MKKYLVLLIVFMFFISGCGKVAEETNDNSSSLTYATIPGPNEIIPTTYAIQYGVVKDIQGNILGYRNNKVDKDYQDRIYINEDVGILKTVRTFYDNNTVKRERYGWDSSTASWTYIDTRYDNIEFNEYNRISTYIERDISGNIENVLTYSYPEYYGVGEITTMNFTFSDTTMTGNHTIVYERSIDGKNVTENQYIYGNLTVKYCYNMVY